MLRFKENRFGEVEAKVKLKSWAGFLDASGARWFPDVRRSNGRTPLRLDGAEERPVAATPGDMQAAKYLRRNEAAVTDSLLQALLLEYPRIRAEAWNDYIEGVARRRLPEVQGVDDLRPLVGLRAVHLGYHLAWDGDPYLGFELGCAWDPERGLGAMMQGARVVEMGSGATVLDGRVVENDRMLCKVADALARRLGDGALAWRTSPWRERRRGLRYEPDLRAVDSTGRSTLAVEIRGFFEAAEYDREELERYAALPDIHVVLWVCPAPLTAVLWTREPGDDFWVRSNVMGGNADCEIWPLDVSFPLAELAHDPEQWRPAFGKDHAPIRNEIGRGRSISVRS